ncbi:50S ribosomal protein L10 [Trueperella pyogenes]|uniref:Large ribosomal subunit protein uL10 n=1 Tax=Trueperella pyogenes TaxID=1661 RepID=X4QY52_9ACTO|nr:50S ribosomal protein L10 [Trueperella pyogenes]AHU89426.1 50S ribosomal protein L10 [Trueperella pyogenes]AJC69181.1 50S ribosomal protein L10 [Trueperella pyogenes TP8]ALD73858.1 50S ribosomal protein L10 [Trueperella pyogenes]AWA43389.1 50S ribosomal protein L10 [Trueperella pyogenes]AWG04170.1 50S ribosomal protein L10 [Trueperella pyogenes]
MKRTDKSAEIAALTAAFRESDAVLLTEYRGLTVEQMKTLRRALGSDVRYHVAKNTLVRIAAKDAGVEGLDEDLTGPTALAFVTGDIASAAKALKNFAKENDKLVLKSGVMEGQLLDAEGVKALADLESREVLLAKAAGALKASLVKAAFVFKAPATKTVRTVDALRAKQETAA